MPARDGPHARQGSSEPVPDAVKALRRAHAIRPESTCKPPLQSPKASRQNTRKRPTGHANSRATSARKSGVQLRRQRCCPGGRGKLSYPQTGVSQTLGKPALIACQPGGVVRALRLVGAGRCQGRGRGKAGVEQGARRCAGCWPGSVPWSVRWAPPRVSAWESWVARIQTHVWAPTFEGSCPIVYQDSEKKGGVVYGGDPLQTRFRGPSERRFWPIRDGCAGWLPGGAVGGVIGGPWGAAEGAPGPGTGTGHLASPFIRKREPQPGPTPSRKRTDLVHSGSEWTLAPPSFWPVLNF